MVPVLIPLLMLVTGACGHLFHHDHNVTVPMCPTLTFVQHLDVKRFQGTWYQHSSYGNIFVHGLDKCVSSSYTLQPDNITMAIHNERQVIKSNTLMTSSYKAIMSSETEPSGNMTLTLHLPFMRAKTVDLVVLGTDYDSWAVMYVCGRIHHLQINIALMFTRKRVYAGDSLSKILGAADSVLANNSLSRDMFSDTDQSECDKPTTLVQNMASLVKTGAGFIFSSGLLALVFG